MLGIHPDTGLEVVLKSGRFGPYVQMGEGKEAKRTGLPKGWEPGEMNLEKALKLLSLPREVGAHPEDGEMISAGLGRYGPFVMHKGKYANIPDVEELFSIGLNRAVDLLAAKAASGTRGGTASIIKKLGEHPKGGDVSVRNGRYGPYVNHGKINATLPRDLPPEEVTLEKALEMIEAKAARGGRKRKTTGKKTTSKKTTGKKTASKKKTVSKKVLET